MTQIQMPIQQKQYRRKHSTSLCTYVFLGGMKQKNQYVITKQTTHGRKLSNATQKFAKNNAKKRQKSTYS